MNEINLQLQGKILTLVDTKQINVSFIEKLNLFYHNISRNEFYNLPGLALLTNEFLPEDIDVYATHLKMLKDEMTTRFQDVINLKIETWMIHPFETSVTDVQVDVQEEMVELQKDITSPGGTEEMWLQRFVPVKYPKL
ncbi:uncharacterized protein LOC106052917 [Biomphalaria glabrata]|uniref:Uncharacterized protein LOC106052917 n=1 Tax=Biomphalaria glabrata TaxID=6526 RepID=A0A9U8DVY9_BIOGL|nr:uncharacterized protein LOC106052917 [Biomphalaria glabrata]